MPFMYSLYKLVDSQAERYGWVSIDYRARASAGAGLGLGIGGSLLCPAVRTGSTPSFR